MNVVKPLKIQIYNSKERFNLFSCSRWSFIFDFSLVGIMGAILSPLFPVAPKYVVAILVLLGMLINPGRVICSRIKTQYNGEC